MDTTPAPPESAAQVRFQLASDLHMHGNGGLGNNLPGYQWSLIPPPPSADYLLLPGDIGAIVSSFSTSTDLRLEMLTSL